MLRRFGVKGVKVNEVVSLDDETLAELPSVSRERSPDHSHADSNDSQPVYGLIFLYKWREDDLRNQVAHCPTTVWFANQVGIFMVRWRYTR